MNQTTHSTSAPGLSFGDILFIIFRHKWKILTICALGILGAVALFFFGPVPYQSEAKVFIKYVVDSRPPAQGTGNDPRLRMPNERTGENVINTEVEILTSLDLAQQAVAVLAPNVLAKLAGGTNLAKAAAVVRQNLLPEVGKKSDVIRVIFKHKDAEVVQPVLKQLIDTYLTRHAEIHRAVGLYDDYLSKQIDQLKSRLTATESDLRKAKAEAHIISIEDSKKSNGEQMVKLRQDIMDTDAQAAERQAKVSAITGLLHLEAVPAASSPVGTNLPAATNVAAGRGTLAGTNVVAAADPVSVPTEKADEYKRVGGLLESLSKRQEEYSLQFQDESPLVKSVREQIAAAEKAKKKLEDENPGLLLLNTPEGRVLASGSGHNAASLPVSGPQMTLITEIAAVSALESRHRVLTNQLEIIRSEAAVVMEAEGNITELERQRQLEEAQYNYFRKNLEELRADEQLGASRNSNIVPFQTPSPPFRDASKLLKAVMGLLFGSIAGAFALAFALEFYLDPSVKRPIEVESRLHLPLFLSIPRLQLNGKNGRLALEAGRTALLAEKTGDPAAPALGGSAAPAAAQTSRRVPPWDSRHCLRPFEDALRDRLITYFDLKNLTHKPKLVALTSCGEGSGVTTIAAGLAASLSETGEGNVLLVDMNELGSAHQFYRGDPACGLEDALELEKRDTALVQDKLYVVRENQSGDKLPRSLPKHFQHLVPKLKASDYDYIIFDLPPISQISVTSKLARFMDVALVVVEAEKTNREVVKRASAFLSQSGANVGVVLNKTRAYGPKRLLQEV